MQLNQASFSRWVNRGAVVSGAIVMGIAVQVAMSPVVHAQVTPAQVMEALAPGESVAVEKLVQTPEIPPNPDILFLADTTGSMGDAIANVKANATAVMNTVIGSQPTAQFAVAEYRDFGDDFVVQTNVDVTASVAAAQAAINTWDADGGGDVPEAQLFALDALANGISWRPGSTRIIAWFGDSSGHDPSGGVTLADAIASLLGESIRVIAIPVDSGFGNGLDATGQATAIANATGGSVLPSATPAQVSDSILAGLMNLPVTVIPTAIDCDPLTVTFNPASMTVTSGEVAEFVETITAPGNAGFCDDVHCFVEFRDENDNLIGVQEIWIEALDVEPPVLNCPDDLIVECDPAVNPGQLADWLALFSASDNCPGVVTDLQTMTVGFVTIAIFTATDAAGNESVCERTFTIVDTTPPVVTVGPAGSIWPPNHKYQAFSLSDCGITVEDVCDGELHIEAVGVIVSMSSDEPEDAKGLGDGATLNDMVILGPTGFAVRRERDGGTGGPTNWLGGHAPPVANGRVYTINFVVTDNAGNETFASCQVGVPHDRSGPAAVDDGPGAGYTIP